MIKTIAVLGGLSLLAGCAGTGIGVKPWQREKLAQGSMQLNPDPTVTGFREHTYFSKEGASGGRSFDGGGCGCN
ncbi:MAG: DUF4266 domain-containing protein [Sphingomonadales bacterium]|nr:DUF4266 domain-containing protein [Sphingomonadales bacterium]